MRKRGKGKAEKVGKWVHSKKRGGERGEDGGYSEKRGKK